MGIVSDIKRSVKIDNMTYDEAVSEIKLLLSDSDKWIFEEMLNNYKKYDAKGNRFPLSKLRLVLRKQVLDKKFDILNNRQYGLKSAYVTHFKNDIYSIKSKKFKDKFKSIRKYEEYVKEQEKYTEFSGVDKLYKEKGETKKTSNYYSNVSSNYFMLETEEEKIKYLEEKYEIQFGIHVSIYSYNLKEKETEYFNKLAESEIENEKRKKEEKEEKKKLSEINSYNDDDDYNKKYSDDEDNNEYNSNSYSNYNTYTYSGHSSSSSSNKKTSTNNYNSNKNYINTTNTKPAKKRVKVILCYSCKSKNKCPLCGVKMGSKVSLGNMYAHENCYNEGTCVLCNKKGPGNQVQSICSDCRKSKSSNGLTGSGRCFICRKLM